MKLKSSFLWLLLALICSAGYSQEEPSILLIQVDDLGIADLAFNGNRHIRTDHIDRLAGEAVVYRDFYVHPLCAPSRASLLTGRHFLRTGVSGVHGGRDFVNLEEVMFPGLLQEAGYATGMWGKWHSGKTDGYFPWDRGFDEGYYATLYNHYDNVGVLNGKRIETTGWATDRITDMAIDFMERHAEERFLAYVSYMAPHEPWYAPDDMVERYMQSGLSRPLSMLYAMIEKVDLNVGRLISSLEDLGIDRSTVVIFLSDNGPTRYCTRMGKLSDEDWGLRNAMDLRGQKGDIWENGIRSPLLIRWKGQTLPSIRYGLCSINDLFPTITGLAGVPVDKLDERLEGENLLPLAPRGSSLPERYIFLSKHTPVFSEEFAIDGKRILAAYPVNEQIKEKLNPADQNIGIRDQRYKLVRMHGDPEPKLFDIYQDPRESSPLSGSSDLLETLQKSLFQWYEELKAEAHSFRMPVHQIGFDGRRETKFYACAPSRLSPGLDNHAHYLTNWTRAGDQASYHINVLTPGKYRVSLVYRIPPGAQYKFNVSAGKSQVTRTIKRQEQDAWFDTLFEQESAYGDMDEIGNIDMGVIRLDREMKELKICLDKVWMDEEDEDKLRLYTINFKRVD